MCIMYVSCVYICIYIYYDIAIWSHSTPLSHPPGSPGQHVRQPAPLRCTGIEAFRRAQGLPKEYR